MRARARAHANHTPDAHAHLPVRPHGLTAGSVLDTWEAPARRAQKKTQWLLNWALPSEAITVTVAAEIAAPTDGNTRPHFEPLLEVTLPPVLSAFADDTGQVGELTACAVSLEIELCTERDDRLRLLRQQSPRHPLRADAELGISEEAWATVLATAALTKQEEVIVIDSWNKVLGWKDLFMDLCAFLLCLCVASSVLCAHYSLCLEEQGK
jgi:hypothetical protein